MNTTEQKVEEVIADLNEWLNKDLSKKDLTVNGIDKINSKFNEIRIPRSIVNGFESVHRWYNNLFVYELLKNNSSDNKKEAVAAGYQILALYNRFLPLYPNNPQGPSFENSAYFLAACLSEQWYKESEIVLNIIDAGLDSGLLQKGVEFKLAAWFIIELANKGYNKSMDYSKYHYPKDIGVYKEALENWNTTNLDLVDEIVTKLSDFHLSEASFGDPSDTGGKKDPMFLQFSTLSWFVFAFEIVGWLSIREMVGIKNPEKLTHPLMNLSLNKLPDNKTFMPRSELFEKILSKMAV